MRLHLLRWLKFNTVGTAGVLVQIGTLWLLVELGHLPYLLATALAIELTVLHNFAWHLRWTWRDRPTRVDESLKRLIRFNLTNGAVSLGGNLLLMGWLTTGMEVPYLFASLASIVACSLLNFFLSEGYVFAGPGRRSQNSNRVRTANEKSGRTVDVAVSDSVAA